jgi:predicted nucleic acid-binding protein
LSIYPDSSFLVSGYLLDRHTPDVQRRMSTNPVVLVTQFHRAEVFNAIFQQVFRRLVAEPAAKRAFADFEQDCAVGIWELVTLPETTFDICVALAQRRGATLGVRTLDSLHAAAALELGATRFWRFDQRQARLAEAEGLITT